MAAMSKCPDYVWREIETQGGSTGFFLRGYLRSLSFKYVATSKDTGKRLPQLYYIKMKISYDLGLIAFGVAMAT